MAGPSAKLERQLNLVAALLEAPRPLTAAEIADRVYGYPEGQVAFRRTFERDKDDLRQMGVPLTMHEIVEGTVPEIGYRISKAAYYLPDPGLEPDELAALHLAASTVRLDGVEATGALWKLGGVPHATKARNAIEKATPTLAALPVGDAVVRAFEAIAARRPVTFRYRGRDRRVDPYRLDFQKGHWYLDGFDHSREAERSFRVDRIEGSVTVAASGTFAPPSTDVPGARREPWELGEGEPTRARVLVDARRAAVARNLLPDAAPVEERPDGSVVVELAVTNVDAFRSFVLSFLDHAEVLEPPELRDAVVRWLDAVIEDPA